MVLSETEAEGKNGRHCLSVSLLINPQSQLILLHLLFFSFYVSITSGHFKCDSFLGFEHQLVSKWLLIWYYACSIFLFKFSLVEGFRDLSVMFRNDGRVKWEMIQWIGASSWLLRALLQSVVVKKELRKKATLLIYWLSTFQHSRMVMKPGS